MTNDKQGLREIFRKYRGNAKIIGENFAETKAIVSIKDLLPSEEEMSKAIPMYGATWHITEEARKQISKILQQSQ